MGRKGDGYKQEMPPPVSELVCEGLIIQHHGRKDCREIKSMRQDCLALSWKGFLRDERSYREEK